jgi:uncharacterized membrane protein
MVLFYENPQGEETMNYALIGIVEVGIIILLFEIYRRVKNEQKEKSRSVN